jgi:hypothetical protein
VELDEVGLLALRELGPAAAQLARRSGDGHPFSGAHADEVGLELGDHGQDVEQQSADRVGGVVDRAAEVERDLAGRQLVGDVAGSERASRSSLVTTSTSPGRQAASASRSPGRVRLVPVSPWST